jgi:ADP-ribose pyrophosphatase YjhB (NUDIX family)
MLSKQVYWPHERSADQTQDGFRYCPRCGQPLTVRQVGNNPPRPACDQCGFVQFRNPAPSVSVMVVDGTRVVLGKRLFDPGKGLWALPSGYIEFDEDFLTAAVREACEETGLAVTIEGTLNVVSTMISPRQHFLNICLLARVSGGTLVAADDLAAVDWFPLGGPLPEMAFAEDADILARYAARPFPGLPADPRYASGEGPGG